MSKEFVDQGPLTHLEVLGVFFYKWRATKGGAYEVAINQEILNVGDQALRIRSRLQESVT